MKRSEALKVLSHQHHQGLFAAMQLKRASAATAGEARSIFLDFYQRHGAHHFRAEEELLLPAYARHTASDRPEVVRALTEHVDLRRRGQDLEANTDPDPSVLRELGERLERHIRFEERELIPMIEEALPVTSSGNSVRRSHAPRAATGDAAELALGALAFRAAERATTPVSTRCLHRRRSSFTFARE